MNILLADDEEGILRIYRELLEGNGHTVSVASKGSEVLRSLEETEFEMLILDLFMPEMDGFVAIQTLRDRGYKVPVIVMTGHFPDEVVYRRLEGLGVSAILRKPVMISTLLNAVNEALS
ncbi:MAG: response regulator [bacterium]|jgi:CheY-like chemotaxis protein|nr:response regulator [bacterium]